MRVDYLGIRMPGVHFCCVCWHSFTHGDGPLPLLHWNNGELMGPVCPTCLDGGAETLKGKLLERAQALRNSAMLIDHELEAGVIVPAPPVKGRPSVELN